MLPQELESIIKKGEGQTVDFKESDILSQPFKLARLMVAFANNLHVSTNYGGLILLGVKNDGRLEEMKGKQGHEEHLMNIARDKCEPSVTPRFEVVSLHGYDVYVLTIPKMTKYPYAVRLQDCNAYYVRVGTTVRVASPEELQELFVGIGKPTINQVVQRVRESVPSISHPYRGVLIAPDYVIKDMIQFNEEIERWLYHSTDLTIGEPQSIQDGAVFKFNRHADDDYFAKITKEGVIYYREPIGNELGGVHIGRTIRVVGEMLEYARKVYERFKYSGACVVKLELGNIKGMRLSLGFPYLFRYNCTFDEDRILLIERELSWIDLTQNTVSVVESIIGEFCRSFGFSITEKVAKDYVADFFKME